MALLKLLPDDVVVGGFHHRLLDAIFEEDDKAVDSEGSQGKRLGNAPVSLSPIAIDVYRINALIPNDKRRENTAKFLKDQENWTILEAAAKEDITRTKAVLAEVFKLLIPGPLYEPNVLIELDKGFLQKLDSEMNQIIHTNSSFFKKDCELEIKVGQIQVCVKRIANFLVAYKKVVEDKDLRELFFKKSIPIGDFAEPLSKALKNLVPDVPEEGSVYESLTNAIKDDDDKAALNKKKSTDDGNKSGDNGSGDAPASGNLGKYFLIGTCIALPLIIIGVVIIFMLRKK